MHPSRCRNRKKIDLVVYEKITHVVVKFCAQKTVGVQFHEKCFSI